MSEVALLLQKQVSKGSWVNDKKVALIVSGVVLAMMVAFLIVPILSILSRSFAVSDGFGLENYINTLGTSRIWELGLNSVVMASLAASIAVSLAYAYAYALQRTDLPFKGILRIVIMVPLFAPSLVQAQGLIFLLGRNGVFNRFLGFDIDIYGFWGVTLANSLYTFPYAFLILSAALAVSDARLYESAVVMGAKPFRIFRTVTLPSTRYGIFAAIFVAFSLSITDFGNAVVIGGNFNVLATEIYNKVIGQGQFGLGAVVGVMLLMPAVISKLLEKQISKRQHAQVTDQSTPLQIRPNRLRNLVFGSYAWTIAAIFLSVPLIVFVASIVKLWPYNMAFSLKHYAFDVQNGTAPLWNSVGVAFATAFLGVVVVASAAIVSAKFKTVLSGPISFLSILPASIPGMVLGLGYVLAFNNPSNPFNMLYGTFPLIVLLYIYYNHAQGFLISSTSLKQISSTFDEASTMLGGSTLRTLFKVTLPLIWPTLLGVGVFFFMRAMVSLSAVIFLITPQTQVAAVSVLQLSDRGAANQAAAFSVCIMLIVIAMLLVVRLVLWLAGAKNVTLIR
ncbi:ABC transporter permease subunit [Rhodobacteraceae bacterium RKSG542]|uniref:ABC transporter permease subunit n=1 Tax=Pseudovibrio flavus TaxID=2529854 RepID=UPI0012BBDFC1|nr:ABC transporter permease subunit [Pseudovibrio flavus]MTI18184.1 ABC transporter permease subunit [Pseudovibrio flavus]